MARQEFFTPYVSTLLETTIKKIKKDPLFKRKSYVNHNQIIKDFTNSQNLFRKYAKKNKKAFIKLSSQSQLLDLIIFEHFSLILMLHEFTNLEKNTIKGLKKGSWSFEGLRRFVALLNNAINNLNSIKYLSSIGLDVQARVLFRNYMESMEMGYAILLNERFFKMYISDPQDEEESKKKFYQTRPKEVLKTIGSELSKIKGFENFWQELLEIRNPYYDMASKGVHVDDIAMMYSLYPTPLESEYVQIGIGGIISNAALGTLTNVIDYSRIMLNHLPLILVYKHRLPYIKFKQDGFYYLFLYAINKEIHLMDLLTRADKT